MNIGYQKSRNPKVQNSFKKTNLQNPSETKTMSVLLDVFFQLFARGFQLELNEDHVQNQLRGNFLFWGGFAWKNLKSLSVPAEGLEQNCIQLHGILQIKLDTHWTPRKTLVLGRQPFQHINLKIGFNRWIFNYFVKIIKVTSEHLNILFNPWIVSSSLKSLKSPVKTWKYCSILKLWIVLWNH